MGPQPLNTLKRGLDCEPLPVEEKEKTREHPPHPKPHEHPEHPPNHEVHKPKPRPPSPEILQKPPQKPAPKEPEHPEEKPAEEEAKPIEGEKTEPKPSPDAEPEAEDEPVECNSGLWLFDDRENITHFFAPNFLPPYNTPEKRKVILDVLKEEWCEKTMSWKPCGEGSMTKKKAPKSAKKELPSTPEEEKTATVDEEKSGSSHLVAKLDDLVGDVLSHVSVCCAPLNEQFNKQFDNAAANKTEETNVS
jgi:hypothetical protein